MILKNYRNIDNFAIYHTPLIHMELPSYKQSYLYPILGVYFGQHDITFFKDVRKLWAINSTQNDDKRDRGQQALFLDTELIKYKFQSVGCQLCLKKLLWYLSVLSILYPLTICAGHKV